MKTSGWIFSLSLCVAAAFTELCATAIPQEMNFPELAGKIVKTSAGVKPGDVVMIFGGKNNLDFIEAIAIEVRRQGGMPQMIIDTDKYERAQFTEVPDKYLDEEPAYLAGWLKYTNVYIGLPYVEDAKAVFGDVPQDKLAKTSKAAQVIQDSLNSSGVRAVFLGYPTRSDAARGDAGAQSRDLLLRRCFAPSF